MLRFHLSLGKWRALLFSDMNFLLPTIVFVSIADLQRNSCLLDRASKPFCELRSIWGCFFYVFVCAYIHPHICRISLKARLSGYDFLMGWRMRLINASDNVIHFFWHEQAARVIAVISTVVDGWRHVVFVCLCQSAASLKYWAFNKRLIIGCQWVAPTISDGVDQS